MDRIKIVFDEQTLAEYSEYYFSIHTKAKKKPILHPYHESINEWMIMKRPMMNALKQRWKDFMVWLVVSQGLANLRISKCDIRFNTYYSTNRRHDVDNGCPKFIIDGLCDGGLIIDDDHKHINQITLWCGVDRERPRTEIIIDVYEKEYKEDKYEQL